MAEEDVQSRDAAEGGHALPVGEGISAKPSRDCDGFVRDPWAGQEGTWL